MSNEENLRDLEESFMMNASSIQGARPGSNPFGRGQKAPGADDGIMDYKQLKKQ